MRRQDASGPSFAPRGGGWIVYSVFLLCKACLWCESASIPGPRPRKRPAGLVAQSIHPSLAETLDPLVTGRGTDLLPAAKLAEIGSRLLGQHHKLQTQTHFISLPPWHIPRESRPAPNLSTMSPHTRPLCPRSLHPRGRGGSGGTSSPYQSNQPSHSGLVASGLKSRQ